MTNIRPITELRNTNAISELCHSTDEPVFITKNGYSDLVIMSHEVYEKTMAYAELHQKIAKSLEQLNNGKGVDGDEFLKKMREKFEYNI